MSQMEKKKPAGRKILSVFLYVLAGILLVTAAAGYYLQGTEGTRASLNAMRTQAVLHAASDGLLNSIASRARSDKLKELRARKDFRSLGLDEVNATCDAAAQAAREEAEALYSSPKVEDSAGLESAISGLENALSARGTLQDAERAVYADIYLTLEKNVPNWTEIVEAAGDDDAALIQALASWAPDLSLPENAYLQSGFLRLAREKAEAERLQKEEETLSQLTSALNGAVSDWHAYADLDDDALWAALTEEVAELAGQDKFRDQLLTAAKASITAAETGEAPAAEESDEGVTPVYEAVADYAWFTPRIRRRMPTKPSGES